MDTSSDLSVSRNAQKSTGDLETLQDDRNFSLNIPYSLPDGRSLRELFDWGEAGQGEEQQEQNDQSVSEADGGAGQGQPQAESSVDAQGAPEPEEATVTVKFYGKEQKLFQTPT